MEIPNYIVFLLLHHVGGHSDDVGVGVVVSVSEDSTRLDSPLLSFSKMNMVLISRKFDRLNSAAGAPHSRL